MSRVAVVDTGLSNLLSISRALEEVGIRPVIATSDTDLSRATHIVLPGVGSFLRAMANLRSSGLIDALRARAMDGVPFLGICLGMQLLATRGYEGGGDAGLALVPGEVTKLLPGPGERLPHIGWNEVKFTKPSPLFEGIDSHRDFYFVHSWALRPSDDACIVAETPFAGGFVSAVARGNVYGVQFHPEKSQKAGMQLLRNFLAL